MMTMSPAPISVEQALDYYRQDYTNAKETYYSEAGSVKGRWCGQLAEEWNLKGEVSSEQYERLVEGKDSAHRRATYSLRYGPRNR